MSFRQRQKFHIAPSCSVFELEEKTLENGSIVNEAVNQSEKVMPDPEMFELENQLKAGINLEEVNSTVLSPKSIDASRIINKLNNNGQTNNNKQTKE